MRYYHNILQSEATILQRIIYNHQVNPTINKLNTIEDRITDVKEKYHLDEVEMDFWWDKLRWCQEAYIGEQNARLG